MEEGKNSCGMHVCDGLVGCILSGTLLYGRTGESEAGAGQIDAEEIWWADSGEIVISSKFLEWCKEHLSAETE